jgi:hypothetical protein
MEKRAVPAGYGFVPPATDMYDTYRRHAADLDEARKQGEAAERSLDARLAALALEIRALRSAANGTALPENVLAALGRVESALNGLGMQVDDLLGRELDTALNESVVVAGWVEGNRDVDYVAETFEPQVTRDGRILHVAKVFGGSVALRLKREEEERAAVLAAEAAPVEEPAPVDVPASVEEPAVEEGSPAASREPFGPWLRLRLLFSRKKK